MVAVVARAIDRLSLCCGIAAAAMIAIAVVVVTYMVIIRALGFSSFWEIEFSVYLMVGATFLGSPYTLRTNGHVAVDLVSTMLPPGPRRLLAAVLSLIGMAVCLYLTVTGAGMTLEALESGERSHSLWHPYVWPLYAMMPLGLGLTVLQYLVEIARPAEPSLPPAARP